MLFGFVVVDVVGCASCCGDVDVDAFSHGVFVIVASVVYCLLLPFRL